MSVGPLQVPPSIRMRLRNDLRCEMVCTKKNLCWADDVGIIAHSEASYVRMVAILTVEIEALGFKWKPKSLEPM